MKKTASKIVSSSILGLDVKVIIVNGKTYVLQPPTIRRISGAGYYLSELEGDSVKDALLSSDTENMAHALSFLLKEDDSLFEELSKGTFGELCDALEDAYSLVSTEDFLKLSALTRNVARLTARQKQ